MKTIRSTLTPAVVTLFLFAATVTTVRVQTLDDLATKGPVIANQDPLALELRTRQPDGPSRRGFDIGMAAAEGQTAPGPGKQRIHDSLGPVEQKGFDIAVAFSLERNRNAELAAKGAAVALADPVIAKARTVDADVFYWLGFDIATGIFGDPALGANGNTATGPGSLKIRDSLSSAAQKGFNASVALNLSRRTGMTLIGKSGSRTADVYEEKSGGLWQSGAATPVDRGDATATKDKANAVPNPSKRLILSAEGSSEINPVSSAKLYLGQNADGEIWLAISYKDGTPFTQARAGDIRIRTLSSSGAGAEAKLDPSRSLPNDGVWHFTLPQITSGSHFYLISVVADIKAWRTTYEGHAVVRATYTRLPVWTAQRQDGTIWQPPE